MEYLGSTRVRTIHMHICEIKLKLTTYNGEMVQMFLVAPSDVPRYHT